MAMTDGGMGVDVAIEALGIPQTFDMCISLIRSGASAANLGVHGKSVELRLQDLWIKDINITTGLASATTSPMLLKLLSQGKIKPEELRDAPLQAERDDGVLRHLQPSRGDEVHEGGDLPVGNGPGVRRCWGRGVREPRVGSPSGR